MYSGWLSTFGGHSCVAWRFIHVEHKKMLTATLNSVAADGDPVVRGGAERSNALYVSLIHLYACVVTVISLKFFCCVRACI